MKITTFNAFKHVTGEGVFELSDEQLKKLKEVLLTILDDISAVCKENQISYTLGGGSVLGAVRHKGFIPWDDDIDLNMPRADYNRFVPLFRQKFGHKYWVHTPEDTKDYPLLFCRIRKKGTCVRGRDDFYSNEAGAFIDIFIMENTPDNKLLRFFHGMGSLAFGFMLSCRKFFRDRKELMKLTVSNPKLKKTFLIKIYIGFFLSLFSVDFYRVMGNRWNSMCHNDHSVYVSGTAGRLYYFGELYRRDRICVSRDASFEGRRLPVPVGSKGYLTHCYGDFMKIPEAKDREHHIVFEFDLGNNDSVSDGTDSI